MHSGRVDDDALAYLAITRLQARYADVVNRRAWAELEPLFVADAPIRIDTVTKPVVERDGAAALGAFISRAVERFAFFEFVILNTVVTVGTNGTARGRLYMVEVRQERATGEWSNAFGLYDDDYVERDGQWLFSRRSYRSLARRTGTQPADV